MLLERTKRWHDGHDAPVDQGVLDSDAGAGMIYTLALDAMLDTCRQKQCFFHIQDARFGADENVKILIRAEITTAWDEGDTEDDVPAAKRR